MLQILVASTDSERNAQISIWHALSHRSNVDALLSRQIDLTDQFFCHHTVHNVNMTYSMYGQALPCESEIFVILPYFKFDQSYKTMLIGHRNAERIGLLPCSIIGQKE